MSIDATRWAWMQTGIKATDKVLLLYLVYRAGSGTACSPSIIDIEDATGLHKSTAVAAVRRLREAGIVETKRRGGQNTLYTLRLNAVANNRNRIQSVQAKKSPVVCRP